MRCACRGEAPGPCSRWQGDGRAAHLGTTAGVGREWWGGEEEGPQVTHLELMHGKDYAGRGMAGLGLAGRGAARQDKARQPRDTRAETA